MTVKMRILATAFAAMGALVATPAFGQHYTAVATAPKKNISYGSTATFKVTFTNTSTTVADTVAPSITAVTLPSGTNQALTVVGYSGCTLTDGALPCVLDPIAPSAPAPADPSTAAVSITVELALPETIPATCPADAALADAVFAVTDGTTSGTVTAPVVTNPYNVFSTTMTPEKASIGSNETFTFTANTENLGPCDAADVYMDFYAPYDLNNGLNSWVLFDSATGATFDFVPDGYYEAGLGPVAAGGKVGPIEIVVKSGAAPSKDLASTKFEADLDVYDADNSDPGETHATSSYLKYTQDSSGCSTGGAGSLLGLLFVSMAGLRRRFRKH